MSLADSSTFWLIRVESIAGNVLFLGLMIAGLVIARSRVHAGTTCFFWGCVLLGIRSVYQLLGMLIWTRELRRDVWGNDTMLDVWNALNQVMPIFDVAGLALLILGIFRAFRWPDEAGEIAVKED